jgi:hypothetical protein
MCRGTFEFWVRKNAWTAGLKRLTTEAMDAVQAVRPED